MKKLIELKPGETAKIRGLDKAGILSFLEAKGHKNLVLRVVDVIEMTTDAQDFLIALLAQCNDAVVEAMQQQELDLDGWRKRFMLRFAIDGWIVLPVDQVVSPLSFDELTVLQGIMFGYAQIRAAKGEPNKVEPCSKCFGSGRLTGKECSDCDGGGTITTFIEMSEEEVALARSQFGRSL